MTEIALPASVLRNHAAARWARDHRPAVEAHTGEELAAAIAAGVHPARVTVYLDAIGEPDLRCMVNLGVGRVVVGSPEQMRLLASVVTDRRQDVVVRMTDATSPRPVLTDARDCVGSGFSFASQAADTAMQAILQDGRLNLVGLRCDVGSHEHVLVSYSAAIGHMIAEMTQIRRNHGVLLTRLGLGGGRLAPSSDWAVALPQLAAEIDESLDDACATLRFPRPVVVLSTGLGIVGQTAA